MRIAFAGNPNSGKTTMYNALTGRNERVGNWAGVTVERKPDQKGLLQWRRGTGCGRSPGRLLHVSFHVGGEHYQQLCEA